MHHFSILYIFLRTTLIPSEGETSSGKDVIDTIPTPPTISSESALKPLNILNISYEPPTSSSPFDPNSFNLEVPPPREVPPSVSPVLLLTLLPSLCHTGGSGAATGTHRNVSQGRQMGLCPLEQLREQGGDEEIAAGGKFGASPPCRDVTVVLPGVMEICAGTEGAGSGPAVLFTEMI